MNKKFFLAPLVMIPLLSLATEGPSFRIIGHRGAAGHAPENTLVGFEKAREMGLYDIELDVQLSKDEEVVLYHDSTMETKTGFKGKVHDYNWNDLKNAEIGSWFDRERGVPYRKYAGTKLSLLKELFEKEKKNFYYHVEIKAADEALPQKVLDLLTKHDLMSQSQVTSFYKEQLIRLRKLHPTLTLCYLIDDAHENDLMQAIRDAKNLGFQGVAIRGPVFTTAQTKLAHDLGLFIRGWGIKDKKDMYQAINSGAEGMTIDFPEWTIYEVLKKLH